MPFHLYSWRYFAILFFSFFSLL